MKALFLQTSTSEVMKYSETLRGLNLGPVETIAYDTGALSDQGLFQSVKERAPDFIVYIGGVFGRQPTVTTLAQITSKIAPMVHLCSDAADAPWWEKLREYHEQSAFALQVAIDGSQKWPLSNTPGCMTALTPVDPAHFEHWARPHAERAVPCGFGGNTGGGDKSVRTQILIALLEKRLIDNRVRSPLPFTYEGYCEYLSNCRVSLNIAHSGTESALQVKGRVLESGLAAACLLETKGAPTSYWFRPGVDYLEYDNIGHAEQLIVALRADPARTEAMGRSLRERILKEHSPALFWGRIFERIGFNATV